MYDLRGTTQEPFDLGPHLAPENGLLKNISTNLIALMFYKGNTRSRIASDNRRFLP